jgi:hypothetical protein
VGEFDRPPGLTPLWNKERGFVKRIALENKIQNADLIYPGSRLLLPFSCEKDLEKYSVIERAEGLREVNPNALVRVRTYPTSQGAVSVLLLPDGRKIPMDSASAAEEKSQSQFSEQNLKRNISSEDAPIAPSVEVRDAEPSFKAYSRLHADGLYGFYRIDSTSSLNGSKALLLSDPSLGVSLGWEQIWTENFSTGVSVNAMGIQMRRASSGSLEKGDQTLSRLGFGLRYRFTPNFETKLYTDYGNQLFVRAVTTGTATIDSVYTSKIGLSVIPTLIQRNDLSLDLELGVFHVWPTSLNDYKIEIGSGFRLAPRLRQKLNQMQMELKLCYDELSQNTTISEQKGSSVGIQFGVSFELGGSQKSKDEGSQK